MKNKLNISESKEYGVILEIFDIELADQFDDFLNGNCYVFSELKFKSDYVTFYFGQASCIEAVNNLLERFKRNSELVK